MQIFSTNQLLVPVEAAMPRVHLPDLNNLSSIELVYPSELLVEFSSNFWWMWNPFSSVYWPPTSIREPLSDTRCSQTCFPNT